ncbi:MAG: PKD domain-containing protein [Candidatus Woesearchaeota archaeon]
MKTQYKLMILLLSIILISFISNAETLIEVTEGDFVNLKVSASDADQDTITYTFSEPLDEEGQWQTGYGDYGEYYIDITVSDGQSETTEAVKLIVNKANWPPVLEEIEDIVIGEGETVLIEPNAEDEEGDELYYYISDPIGEDGIWETSYEDAGEYFILVTATDSQHDPVSQEFTIIVQDINQDPEVLGYSPKEADIEIDEGKKQIFALDANDPDNNKLEYRWELDGELVSKKETFIFETDYKSAGDYALKGTVSDGKVIMGVVWDIEVEDINSLPVIEGLKDITVEEGDLIKLKFKVSDEDGDNVTYSISDPIGDDKEWQTWYDSEGTYEVDVLLSDGKEDVVETFKVIVKDVDRAPEFNEIEDITINEMEQIEIGLQATDPDGDSITFTVENLPEGAILDGDEFTFNTNKDTVLKQKSWINSVLKFLRIDDLIYRNKKKFKVTFVATGREESTENKVKIIVNNVNRFPSLLDLGDLVVNEGEIAYVTPQVIEEDNDRIKFTISDPVGNNGKWKTDYDDAGTYEIEVTASDREHTDSQNITLIVNNVNRAPEFKKVKPIDIEEGKTISLSPVVEDLDGDEIELTIDDLPYGANFENNQFTWTPYYDVVEYRGGTTTYEIKFTATDGSSVSEQTAQITVEDVNRAPEFNDTWPASSVKVYKGVPILFKGNAEDPDGNDLTYNWDFGMFDELEYGEPVIKRTFTSTGDKKIKLTVSDGDKEITKTWKIKVVENPFTQAAAIAFQEPEVEQEVEVIIEPVIVIQEQVVVQETIEDLDKVYNLEIVYDGRAN